MQKATYRNIDGGIREEMGGMPMGGDAAALGHALWRDNKGMKESVSKGSQGYNCKMLSSAPLREIGWQMV